MAKLFLILSVVCCCQLFAGSGDGDLQFTISFEKGQSEKALDGRLLLLISNNNEKEPRFQIVDGAETQLAFGIDVDGLKPGEKAQFDDQVLGYPLRSLAEIPAGEYWVQGL